MTESAAAKAQGSRPRRHEPMAVPLRPPRSWHLRYTDLVAIAGLNLLVILGMWVRHGGPAAMTGSSGFLTGLGQVAALVGTYTAILQLVLMSRSPGLEQLVGMDRLAQWHRRLGIATAFLILGHVLFTTAGYALGDGNGLAQEFWVLVTEYPWMLAATAGTVLLFMVVLTSIRIARRRLSYETWHFVHLYAYLAIALAFGHELVVGSDLSADPVARTYWIALYAVAAGLMLAFRVGHPLRMTMRHQLRVQRVVPEGPGVVSLYVSGRELGALRARAGQFFKWRFLTGDGWWRSHPFSLSAVPTREGLRLTIKDVGEGSGFAHRMKPGTRIGVEGPYGIFTSAQRRRARVLLIAGGIGITPMRALLEELPAAKGAIALIYRARTWEDVIFREELEKLIADRQGQIHFVIGRRGHDGFPDDPLAARHLRRMVPDLRERDVYICGPEGMTVELTETLRDVGMPPEQVHFEKFALL
ncbi:MAG: ferredoxin reductase family protein [Candidatus Dormibacteria bacterium]